MLLMAGILGAALVSLFFSTIAYALRDFSRSRLEDAMEQRRKGHWLEPTVDRRLDLIFATSVGRLAANLLIVIGSVRLFERTAWADWGQYLGALVLSGIVSLLASVAAPMALAQHFGESVIAIFVRPIHWVLWVLMPLVKGMHAINGVVRRVAGSTGEPEPEQIEKDIMSVVEEGEKEGVVDTQEREMIESVIEFHDRQVNQTMTARPEIVAIEIGSTMEEIRQVIETSGHSRIPVYDGTLDHILGILYARDLLKYLGESPAKFDMRMAMRPAVFVPETKLLRDLLRDFRTQKVHIAIVLDEYGGTAGLVTIEDILEELVGEISDEHEPHEPAMFQRIDERTYEVDARTYIEEFNRLTGLGLPEDAGYDTLGGFVSNVLGRIPQKGTTFEQNSVRYTVLDAEPQRVKRLRIEAMTTAEAGKK